MRLPCVSGDSPMSLPGCHYRLGLCNGASATPRVARQAGLPELRIKVALCSKHVAPVAVSRWSGGGPMSTAQAIGVDALVGVKLAAGEADITFSIAGAVGKSRSATGVTFIFFPHAPPCNFAPANGQRPLYETDLASQICLLVCDRHRRCPRSCRGGGRPFERAVRAPFCACGTPISS